MSLAPRLDRLENAIINAPMEIWQRVVGNTTTINTATPTSGYTADRMQYGTSGSTVKNFSIVRDGADTPSFLGTGNQPCAYSYKFSCLTAIASPAATDVVNPWQYRLEGYDYAKFHANAATFSFWIKVTSTATFPIAVPVAFGNGSRSYVTTVSVTANNTWQQCVVNLTMDSAGGYAFDNTLGLKITIASGATGTNFLATPNTWVSGDFFSVSGAFNSMGVNTNVIRIAAPQFMLGTLDTPTFARAGRSFAHEVQMCQRYYEKSQDLETLPNANVTATDQLILFGTYVSSSYMTTLAHFKVTKRATPNATSYDATGATNAVSVYTGGGFARTDGVGLAAAKVNTHYFYVRVTPGASVLVGFNFSVEAEL